MTLEVHDLCYSYGTTQILHQLSFSARAGQFTALLGRNGSGKSTLFRVLAGILKQASGSVRIGGTGVERISGRKRARLIGYLPQFHQTVFPFSVEEVVLTGRAAYVYARPSRSDREKARAAIARLEIDHLAERAYTDLSGGERQLVMIARVLAQEPEVILLDEPISHLDLANQHLLLATLSDLASDGITVIAVLHDPNIAFLHADSIVFMRNGGIITPAEGTPPWDSELIEEVYGIAAETLPYRDRGLIVPRRPTGRPERSLPNDDRRMP